MLKIRLEDIHRKLRVEVTRLDQLSFLIKKDVKVFVIRASDTFQHLLLCCQSPFNFELPLASMSNLLFWNDERRLDSIVVRLLRTYNDILSLYHFYLF